MVNFRLDGQVAIVTGGSRGIGKAISFALAEAGASVVVAARKLPDIEATVTAIHQAGGEAFGVETNVRERTSLEFLVNETMRQFGRLNILINNAGTNPAYGPPEEVEERAWDVIMNTNVKSPFMLSQLVHGPMKQSGGGSIVNVSSIEGLRPTKGIGTYSTSKAALIMLSRVLAMEWGKDNIRVNCLAPGLVQTEFSRALWQEDAGMKWGIEQAALGRIGQPEDMAGSVVYLCSDAARYVTGALLVADGGLP